MYALNMCVGFEPLGCAQRIERKAFPQFRDSRLGPYVSDALDSELEEFAELRAFWLGSKGLAERVGFEPTVGFPLHTLSKRAPSTTRTSLRFRINDLRAVRRRLSHTPPLSAAVHSISFALSGLRRTEDRRVGELCQTS